MENEGTKVLKVYFKWKMSVQEHYKLLGVRKWGCKRA